MAVQLKEYPLGECEIKYTPLKGSGAVEILTTLKEEECSLHIGLDGYKIEVDQLEGPYKYITKLAEALFKCSVILNLEQYSKLTNLIDVGTTGMAFSTNGKEMQVGKLEIHPISAGTKTDYDIVVPKAFLKPDLNISFKKDGMAKADLVFEFAADENKESPTYRKLFTIGPTFAKALMLDRKA